jgi:Transposase
MAITHTSAMNRKQRKDLARRLRSADPGLDVMHPNAAGIDVGNSTHYVAVRPDRDAEPVRRFDCFTADLHRLADWLVQCGVATVAMQSTGVYWIPLYEILEARGLDVYLVNARHTKNLPGRKSDVQESQWLLKLHTYGLLRNSARARGPQPSWHSREPGTDRQEPRRHVAARSLVRAATRSRAVRRVPATDRRMRSGSRAASAGRGRLMIPLTMIVFDEVDHCSSEVALSESQHPVKAFLLDGPDESFGEGVRIRCLPRRLHYEDATLRQQPAHFSAPLRFPVTNQQARRA